VLNRANARAAIFEDAEDYEGFHKVLGEAVARTEIRLLAWWHAHRRSAGSGHVYQGRFKSFPVQDDEHFYTVARYVGRNALRANLVKRAEQWPWCSLHRWLRGLTEDKE
jgi:putative transposase